jgi:hypothetical protein
VEKTKKKQKKKKKKKKKKMKRGLKPGEVMIADEEGVIWGDGDPLNQKK